MNQGRRIFALAQLYIRHPEYKQFIQQKRQEGWFIIMDNGTGDFDLITADELLQVTKELLPNEVIAPDILFDTTQTIEQFESFVEKMDKVGLLDKVDIFFCPQGRTKDEWLECYLYALEHPLVKTIGMSKLSIPQCFDGGWDKDQNIMQARHKCYDFLLDNDLIHKPLHFLGAGNPLEFMYYEHPLVRSTDSCFSVLAAINNKNWKSMQTERIPTPKDYFTNYSLPEDKLHYFVDNVEVLANICNHK
jgi:hypothetical protein